MKPVRNIRAFTPLAILFNMKIKLENKYNSKLILRIHTVYFENESE